MTTELTTVNQTTTQFLFPTWKENCNFLSMLFFGWEEKKFGFKINKTRAMTNFSIKLNHYKTRTKSNYNLIWIKETSDHVIGWEWRNRWQYSVASDHDNFHRENNHCQHTQNPVSRRLRHVRCWCRHQDHDASNTIVIIILSTHSANFLRNRQQLFVSLFGQERKVMPW